MAMTAECEASEGVIFIGHTPSVVCYLARLKKIDTLLCQVVNGISGWDQYICETADDFPEPPVEPVVPEPPLCPIYCPPPKESMHVLIVEVTPAMLAALEATEAMVCELYQDFKEAEISVKSECPEVV
jgi:hypothetical protein